MPSFSGKMGLADRFRDAKANNRTVRQGTALKCVSEYGAHKTA